MKKTVRFAMDTDFLAKTRCCRICSSRLIPTLDPDSPYVLR